MRQIIHGKISSYTNYRCRCEECKLIWNDYCARTKANRRALFDSSRIDVEHGTEKTYQRGCVCDPCRLAHNQTARLRRRFITEDQYTDMLDSQSGECGICRSSGKLVIDHVHTTGQIRGLLCHTCNTGLGKLGDNIDGLRKAIAYLEKSLIQ